MKPLRPLLLLVSCWIVGAARAVQLLSPSAPLTEEERATLSTPPFADDATIRAAVGASSTRQSAQQSFVDALQQRVFELNARHDQLSSITRNLQQETARTFTARNLRTLARRLQETLQQEKRRRSANEDKLSAAKKQKEQTELLNRVSLQQLHSAISWTDAIQTEIRGEEQAVEEWMEEMVAQEWEQQVFQHLNDKRPVPRATRNSTVKHVKQSFDCVDIVGAANLIQSSLISENIVHEEHLEKGTIVYYNAMTSPTYTPPRSVKDWAKYIPQDWERLLPEKWWEKIDLDAFSNSALWLLGLPIKNNAVMSAETVLNNNINRGSCWPMRTSSFNSGQESGGKITIRLAYPVRPTTVIYEHFPVSQEEGNGSAPRFFSVIGYPPCRTDDEECRIVGFSVKNSFHLGSFEYKLVNNEEPIGHKKASRSIQSFDLLGSQKEETEQGDSCDVVAASCSGVDNDPFHVASVASKNKEEAKATDASIVAAITIEVHENWGNSEYTCLYRFRLLGDVVDT